MFDEWKHILKFDFFLVIKVTLQLVNKNNNIYAKFSFAIPF